MKKGKVVLLILLIISISLFIGSACNSDDDDDSLSGSSGSDLVYKYVGAYVTDADTGEPIEDARVYMYDCGGTFTLTGFTDSDGRVVLTSPELPRVVEHNCREVQISADNYQTCVNCLADIDWAYVPIEERVYTLGEGGQGVYGMNEYEFHMQKS